MEQKVRKTRKRQLTETVDCLCADSGCLIVCNPEAAAEIVCGDGKRILAGSLQIDRERACWKVAAAVDIIPSVQMQDANAETAGPALNVDGKRLWLIG